jgi:hypothetical protein
MDYNDRDSMANALYHWVTESTKSHMFHGKTIEKHIDNLLKEQPLTTDGSLVVYRGHDSDSRTIRATSWFSTSNDVKKVRRQHISKGADCCLFKLHILPGIHVIKVDEVLDSLKSKKTGYDESEIIVEGGHTFYDSKDLTSPGFKDSGLIEGVQVFETWYSPKGKSPKKSPKKSPRKTVSKRRILAIIDPEEYDLINGVEDLKVSVPPSLPGETISNATYNEVWKSIQRRKGTKGGRRTQKHSHSA